MVRGAWRVTVHGVTKSQTGLSAFHTHARSGTPSPAPPAGAHLVGADRDGLFEQQPHDALLAGRRGEGAVVGPIVPAGGEQA